MRAEEFESIVSPNGHIELPPQVTSQVAKGQQLKVVVMWDDGDDDMADWRLAGNLVFESAYCPEDAIYEKLPDEPATR